MGSCQRRLQGLRNGHEAASRKKPRRTTAAQMAAAGLPVD